MRWQALDQIQHRIFLPKERNGGVGSWRWLWNGMLLFPQLGLGGLLRLNFVCSKRFDVWCQTLKLEDTKRSFEEVMPPLDVIMVISLSWSTSFLAG
jgi:hypothetical protein